MAILVKGSIWICIRDTFSLYNPGYIMDFK